MMTIRNVTRASPQITDANQLTGGMETERPSQSDDASLDVAAAEVPSTDSGQNLSEAGLFAAAGHFVT
jgi:hypothetical protein